MATHGSSAAAEVSRSATTPHHRGIGGMIRHINIAYPAWKISCLNTIQLQQCLQQPITFIGVNIMKKLIIIILYSGFSCTQDFLKRFQKEIDFIAPAVPEGALLTTGQLCGTEYWDPLSKWEKTLAGACMVYLVEHNRVPFEYVPRTGRNPYPLQFRIKASYTPNQ